MIAGLVLLLAAGIGAGRGFSPGDVPALEGRPTPVTTPVTASLAQGRPSVLVQALASFDDVWQTINDSYYDPTFGGLDWNAVRAEFRPRAEAARSVDEVRQVIREMLGRLKQSHFVLMSPSSVDDTLPGPAAVAVELRVAPPDIVITHVVPTSPAATAGLRAGEVLVAIDGRLASDWMKRMAVEAANTRLRLFEIWKRAFRELHGASGSIAVVRVRGQDGRERDVRVTRSIEQGLPVGFGNLPPVHVRVESAPVTTPRGRRAGLIAFNLWMPQIDVPFAQAIDKFRAADGLVIDLRGNPGGLAGLMVGISGHFIAEPSVLGETRTRENKLTFRVNPRFSTPDGRAVTPFAGPVAILVDELSASATECFAGALQSLGRVRVFGRQTMGQALPAMTKRLATGDVLMYALGDFVTSTGRRLEGDGVIPDEVVPLSIAGLAAGRDATLDAALAWLDKAPLALQPPLLLSSSDLHVRNSTRVRRAHLTQE